MTVMQPTTQSPPRSDTLLSTSAQGTSTLETLPRIQSTSAQSTSEGLGNNHKLENALVNMLQLCQQTLLQVTQKSEPSSNFCLQSAMAVCQTQVNAFPSMSYSVRTSSDTSQMSRPSFGVPASSISDIYIISPEVRQQIVADQEILTTGAGCRGTANTMSTTIPDSLDCAIENLWNHALSRSTLMAYEAGMDSYTKFLLLHGTTWDDGSLASVIERLLMRFAAFCDEHKQIKHSTIKLYLCGIRFFYLKQGGFNPMLKDGKPLECLKTILVGIKKKQGSTSKCVHLPITMPILSQMCNLLKMSVFGYFNSFMLEAACVAAFFGFLRCGEFTVLNQFDSESHLCLSDVQISTESVFITLKKSKTDPFRQVLPIKINAYQTAIIMNNN
ncbi:uncharacterized protein LOC134269078 [Saccostrea cucullata]|uniref:uncharacterized protein LOC134269078 n=1 Tax=Saccostrea cuccullata TaxID=36930 RepID=UPI002ED2FE90